MSRNKKMFYFVSCKDYFYCVPFKDLVTSGDPSSVQVQDVVTFKYNSLTLEGLIRFVSSRESEVLNEIRKEKKVKRKREKSFHADRPRDSAMRRPKPTNTSVTVKQELKDPLEIGKGCQKEKDKKAKDALKAAAINLTEQSMVLVQPSAFKDLKDLTSDSSEVTMQDSGSSVETQSKAAREQGSRQDIASLKSVNLSSSSEEENPSGQQTKALPALDPKPKHDLIDDTFSVSEKPSHFSTPKVNLASEKKHDVALEKAALDARTPQLKVSNHHRSSFSSGDDQGMNSDLDISTEPISSIEDSQSGKKRKHSSDSDSDSPDDTLLFKQLMALLKRRTKSKNKRRRRVNSLGDSDSSVTSDDQPSKPEIVIKRNLAVFPGKNYRFREGDENVIRVHPDYAVYTSKTLLDDALTQARSPQTFIKALVPAVYTDEALRGSTAQGFPIRNKGRRKLTQSSVRPRLDPEGRRAILKRAADLEDEKKSWRPRIGQSAFSQAFSQVVGSFN